MSAVLIRTLKLSRPYMYGADVQAIRRACLKFNGEPPSPLTTKQQRTFGGGMKELVLRAQDQAVVAKTGVVEPNGPLMKALRRGCDGAKSCIDSYGDHLLEVFAAGHRPPSLIEPRQGFDSLDRSLWDAYTIGRRKGLSDVGTYNPNSTLPSSGRPSDHATGRKDGRIGQPVVAFDLGFHPQNGQANADAKWFFNRMIGRPEVAYEILGDKIWSESQGLHAYTHGGHDGHVHVSGHRR